MRILSEEELNVLCECEDLCCRYFPLHHFEECPKCLSKAWHRIPFKKKEVIKNE